jgi:outer membrane protein assembly factor BamB
MLSVAKARQTPQEEAKQILDATGVKGGLIVHVGCGDGKLTAALHASDSYLVHGLDTNPKNVAKARNYVQSLGIYGRVSFDTFDGKSLPYIDNLASLIISKNETAVAHTQVMRVLRPLGVAYLKKDGKWTKIVKPWPDEIDEWTHFLHGPDGNLVAKDSAVTLPFHMQWVGDPGHSKSHSHLSTINVIVSAGGRIFYIVDEGPTALPFSLPSRWALFARDAFNGVTLWRRPISSWQPSEQSIRHFFPVDLFRRLVADKDKVYATLSIFGPVVALDAATGKTIMSYEGTDNTEEMIYHQGVLFLVISTTAPDDIDRRQLAVKRTQAQDKRIMAVKADTGNVLWEKHGPDTMGLMPMTLAAKGKRIFFQNTDNIICLDSQTGKELWRSPRPSSYARPSWSAPTLVVYDDFVLSADRWSTAAMKKASEKRAGSTKVGKLVVLSAETGERLLTTPSAEGCGSPIDVFVVDGLVWVGEEMGRKEPDYRKVRDLRTGKIVKQYPPSDGWVDHHHHRCYRDKATEKYILAGRTGVEFIDLNSGELTPHHWIRGICKYGILPCNGLLYLPPDQCGCYIDSKLTGFHALAPRSPAESSPPRHQSNRLEKGLAYSEYRIQKKEGRSGGDWPTYRGNPARSGYTQSPVGLKLKPTWTAKVGGKLTQPVVADGRVFVASVNAHTINALYADTGKTLWTYTAGARIDSPPTIANGLAVFGCRDGWVYSLRASDGKLAWRFRAAPEDRKLVAHDQTESVWPVHGSILVPPVRDRSGLVQNGALYCAAGRSSYLDGGVYMYKLDLASGKTLLEKNFYSRDHQTGGMLNLYEPFKAEILPDREMPGVLPDVLSSDGKSIWMRSVTFSPDLIIQKDHPPHLFCSMGFLDDSWWERTYWIYGPHFFSGAAGVHFAKGVSSAGRILIFDETSIYGYQDETFSSVGMFSSGKEPTLAKDNTAKFKKPKWRNARHTKVIHEWYNDVPFYAHGLVLADQTIFIAGPPKFDERNVRAYLTSSRTDNQQPLGVLRDALDSFEGRKGALMWAVNKADGKKLAEYKLESPPVFDGMAAANGRLYVSMKNGRILCLGPTP